MEVAVFLAVVDNVLGQCRPQTGDIGEQLLAGSVDVHAHAVDTALDSEVQCLFELVLVNIVLVLPHPYRLGVDFHQLGKRVEQAPSYRDCAAHGHVLVGKLLAGNGRGRVDRGAILAHHIHVHLPAIVDALQEALGLAAGGAVAQGDGIDVVFLHQLLHGGPCTVDVVVWSCGINHRVVLEVAVLVEAHHLAPRTEARVDGQHALVPQRRGKEQLAGVARKHLDGLVVGNGFGLSGKLGLDRGLDQAFVAVGGSLLDQACGLPVATHHDAAHIVDGPVVVDVDGHLEEALLLAAAHGQQLVRRHAPQGLAVVVVVLIVAAFNLLAFHIVRSEHGLVAEGAAHAVAHGLVLAHPLGNDVLCPGNSCLKVGHLVGDIGARTRLDVVAVLRHDDFGQGLETTLAGHLRTGAALGLERQVDVFEGIGAPAIGDFERELVGELVLSFDRLEDGRLALLQVVVIVEAGIDRLDGHIIEPACGFLAVTADERD